MGRARTKQEDSQRGGGQGSDKEDWAGVRQGSDKLRAEIGSGEADGSASSHPTLRILVASPFNGRYAGSLGQQWGHVARVGHRVAQQGSAQGQVSAQ